MPCRVKGEPRNLIVQYCTMKSKVNPEPRAPSWVFYINYTLLDISNSINLSKCGVETHRSVVSIAHAHPWRVPLPLLQFHCSSRTAAWYRNSICSMLPWCTWHVPLARRPGTGMGFLVHVAPVRFYMIILIFDGQPAPCSGAMFPVRASH